MGEDGVCLTMGKTPLERAHNLLSKLDSIRASRDRGSRISRKVEELFYKFIEQVELIFNNIPMPLKWLSFLLNDLVLLTSIPFTVQRVSVEHGLNKAQIKALAKLDPMKAREKWFFTMGI